MAETIKGINIKLSLDGRDLENELKVIKTDLKEQQKDLKAINQNLRYDSTNLELWKNKQNKLNDILQNTKKKLETQNLELEKAKKAVKLGEISESEFNQIRRSVSYTEAEVLKLNNELEKTRGKINILGNANFDKISKIGGTLTKSITVPVVSAVSALGILAKNSADTADELFDASTKIGLSVEALQEWNHTATLMGVSTESLNKGFIKVNGILGDIASGKGSKVADSLASIGLSVDDLKGKNTDEAFEVIRSALASVGDESLRVGIANEFFGDKIGSELLPILSAEKTAITDLRNEAIELGIVTSAQAEVTGAFNDTLDQVKQSAASLGVELSVAVLPIMQSLLEKVRDEIIPTLKSWIDKWNNLDETTKTVILTIVGIISALGPLLMIIGKVGPILKMVSTGFKTTGLSGLFAGTGINFATLGIGALIAIIGVALLSSEEFRAILAKLGETLMKLITPIMDIITTLMDALQPVLDVIIDLIVMLVDLLAPIIELILQPFIFQIEMLAELFKLLSPLIEVVGNILSSILVPAIEVLKKVLEPILSIVGKIVEFLSKIFEWVGELGGKMGDVVGEIGDVVSNVTGKVGDFASNVVSGVGDFAKGIKDNVGNVLSGIGDMAKNAVSGIGNFASNVKNKVGGFFGKVGNFFSDTFNLKQNKSVVNSSSTSSKNTTNNVTVNTTSSTFDIDSINKALGGSYL